MDNNVAIPAHPKLVEGLIYSVKYKDNVIEFSKNLVYFSGKNT